MNIDTIEEHDNYYHCYDVDDMQQLLAYLEYEIKRKSVDKNWKRWARFRIETLKQNIKKEYLK